MKGVVTESGAGWTAIGEPAPSERVWRFTSFDPEREEDRRHRREKMRFRDVVLPEALKGWFEPSFDDSKWQSGLAPIGKGPFERDRRSFESHGRELAPLPLDLYPCTGDGWRIRAQKKQQAASRKVPLKQERCMRNVWEQSRPRVEVDSL